ncbi:MAG: methyltransferase domain-containing protein [Gemmatimonadaceae bacterium]|nr:methyltransferase domain-containing protein [Gemmatimonadaceae bacterium]
MSTAEVIDYEEHWSSSVETYESHPTSRHRRRFVMSCLSGIHPRPGMFVFDYGSGAGLLLGQIQSRFGMPEMDFGGCDISLAGIEAARKRLPGATFIAGEFPALERGIDIAITSEVIEHTAQYREVLAWLADHMKSGADLIITTPGATLDPPDHYYGHIQHFTLEHLGEVLGELGFTICTARYWGFPFFTLQKWVTKRNFDRIRDQYMHGELNLKKKAIFALTYYTYFVHDLFPKGPQIFIHARKK